MFAICSTIANQIPKPDVSNAAGVAKYQKITRTIIGTGLLIDLIAAVTLIAVGILTTGTYLAPTQPLLFSMSLISGGLVYGALTILWMITVDLITKKHIPQVVAGSAADRSKPTLKQDGSSNVRSS